MKRWWLLLLLILLGGLFFAFDLQRFITLETLKNSRDELQRAYLTQPLRLIGYYASVYIIIAALSLPGAAMMTLAAGAIFGLWVGIPVAVISADIGATFVFPDVAVRVSRCRPATLRGTHGSDRRRHPAGWRILSFHFAPDTHLSLFHD